MAVGGVGGSGTRVVQAVLERLGLFMGSDLNDSRDNLWFTFLFVRGDILQASEADFAARAALFGRAMRGAASCRDAAGAGQDSALIGRLSDAAQDKVARHWQELRAAGLRQALSDAAPLPGASGPWGWKEPNTHVVLDRLLPCFPGMKYIHVIRNGLDMAYSDNQNQPRRWGPPLFGLPEGEITPARSLAYWHQANRRALQIGETMGGNFFTLSYDDLCATPEPTLEGLLGFLGIGAEPGLIGALAGLVRPPATIGRFRQHPGDDFDPQDIRFVSDLGFPTR